LPKAPPSALAKKRGQWQLALSLLSGMPIMKVTPDEISYSAAIKARHLEYFLWPSERKDLQQQIGFKHSSLAGWC
jgi:hypothetical protein